MHTFFSSDISDARSAASLLIHELAHIAEAHSLGRVWPGIPDGFFDSGDYVETLVDFDD